MASGLDPRLVDLNSRSVHWQDCWNHFYSTVGPQSGENSPKVGAVGSYPYAAADSLNTTAPSLMHHNDTVASFSQQIDPSLYTATSCAFLGWAGSSFSLADVNFRVPAALFQYVPAWLREAQRVDALKQDNSRWDMRKQQITSDWKMLPRAVLASIARLADDCFANLRYWFQLPARALAPLTHRVSVLATRATQTATKWAGALAWVPFTSAMHALGNVVSRSLEYATNLVSGFKQAVTSLEGLLAWCGSRLNRMLGWFSS